MALNLGSVVGRCPVDNLILLKAALRQPRDQRKILIAMLVNFEAAFGSIDETIITELLKAQILQYEQHCHLISRYMLSVSKHL